MPKGQVISSHVAARHQTQRPVYQFTRGLLASSARYLDGTPAASSTLSFSKRTASTISRSAACPPSELTNKQHTSAMWCDTTRVFA